ncbi:unnamed protein product [Meganyctiphanes norvegica]|uniref:SH2 domain-containing protein n=1 Tax=Meganyctiphanes norvegica TaxID=48144 RepID=A0AAV2PXN6_MEGNR
MEATGLHQFTANAPDEVSFAKGQKIKIVSTKNGSNWYTADVDEKRGMVPSNYVKMENNSWYSGKLTREQSENLLRYKHKGAFLIRDRESDGKVGVFTLSAKCSQGFEHFKILHSSDGKYHIWSKRYDYLNELVHYHRSVSVSMKSELILRDNNERDEKKDLNPQKEVCDEVLEKRRHPSPQSMPIKKFGTEIEKMDIISSDSGVFGNIPPDLSVRGRKVQKKDQPHQQEVCDEVLEIKGSSNSHHMLNEDLVAKIEQMGIISVVSGVVENDQPILPVKGQKIQKKDQPHQQEVCDEVLEIKGSYNSHPMLNDDHVAKMEQMDIISEVSGMVENVRPILPVMGHKVQKKDQPHQQEVCDEVLEIKGSSNSHPVLNDDHVAKMEQMDIISEVSGMVENVQPILPVMGHEEDLDGLFLDAVQKLDVKIVTSLIKRIDDLDPDLVKIAHEVAHQTGNIMIKKLLDRALKKISDKQENKDAKLLKAVSESDIVTITTLLKYVGDMDSDYVTIAHDLAHDIKNPVIMKLMDRALKKINNNKTETTLIVI